MSNFEEGNFKDPEDEKVKNAIYDEIKEIKSGDEALRLINKYSPHWITSTAHHYAPEYKNLEDNWKKVCSQTGAKPQKILLVKKVAVAQKSGDYTILGIIGEILTRAGYCVRADDLFKKCKCGLVIHQMGDNPSEYCYACS